MHLTVFGTLLLGTRFSSCGEIQDVCANGNVGFTQVLDERMWVGTL